MALLCVGVGIMRFVLVVATVPYAVYVNQRAISEAKATGAPLPDKSIAERVARSGPWVSWWSERTVPYREGGDYLGVMSHHKTSRNIGCVLGVLTAQDVAKGIAISKVVTPTDRTALYGEESGNLMVRADGTTFRTGWASPKRDIRMFSDVPVVERPYDPVLTPRQSAKLAADAGLVKRSKDFFVGAPWAGGSGTWILFVREGERREYLFIPIEASRAAGAQ